jgi:hypothetical protein
MPATSSDPLSGYFTVNGVRQPDGVWISAAPSESVQYVAGASPGSDTLGVGIFDATTNSNISTSVVATTVHAAPVVTAVPNVSLSIPVYAAPSTEVQYVGGSSPSSDTLSVGIYDLTTNSYLYAPNSVVATTTQAEGNASGILFQNPGSGQASIWDMNGSTLIGGGPVSPNPGPSWTEAGAGDFNADGHSDILGEGQSISASSLGR